MQQALAHFQRPAHFLPTQSRPAAAKRFAAGLDVELEVGASGKVLRPDRFDLWEGERGAPKGADFRLS